MRSVLNPRLTFETFVVGQANSVAVTAAKAVAENPGASHNPLFVYSATGLGKTHLLMAVAHAALAVHADLAVEYLTLDDFIEGFREAVSSDALDDFRARFGAARLILLDDVQFLAGRHELQEELLRVAGDLQASGAQLVLTSDRPPSEIQDFDERLIGTLAGGLVVDIGPPEYETRLAILRRRAEERGSALEESVLEVVAGRGAENVRTLLGELNRVIAFQAVSEAFLTPDAAVALLGGQREDRTPRAPAAEDTTPRDTYAATMAAQQHVTTGEFDDFLTGVTEVVSDRIEGWKTRVRAVIEEWSARGFETASVDALLDHGSADGVDEILTGYVSAAERLTEIGRAVEALGADTASRDMLRDPDRLADAEAFLEKLEREAATLPAPSEAFSLAEFIDGSGVEMAMGAISSVCRQPSSVYNPLVIVGPSGSGKTHLLHAAGRELVEVLGDGRVACLSAQSFMDELVGAIEHEHIPAWRMRYRSASAFLLDNIDLIGARDRIQDEMFLLFNLLIEADRQLIFTSSVVPREIEGLDERLISRLEGGLVATLDPPDEAMRHTAIVRLLEARTGGADTDLVNYLAKRPAGSIRAVLGSCQRVMTAAEARGAKPTVSIAREMLEAVSNREARQTPAPGVGVFSPPSGVRSPEKMVWHWPEPVKYAIEEAG